MRKSDLALLGILFCIGILGGYLIAEPLFKNSFGRPIVLDHPDGQIIHVANDVRLRAGRQLGWAPAQLDQGILYGDQIFVGTGSFAQLQLKQMKIDLLENSLLNLTKTESSSALELSQGSLNLSLQGDEKVDLNLGGKSLSVQGSGAEFTLSKNETADTKSMGLSFIKGKSEVTILDPKTGKPRKIRGVEGGSVVLDAKDEKIRFKIYDLDPLTPAVKDVRVAGEKVTFSWKPLPESEKIEIEIATDAEFKNILQNISVPPTATSAQWTLPDENKNYFWRMRVQTKSKVSLLSSSRSLQAIQLRGIKIFSPIYTFINPLKWNAKIILEEVPGVAGYELELAQDSGFKSGRKILNATQPRAELTINAGSTFYARARIRYPHVQKNPPWSETIQLSIPSPPAPPEIHIKYLLDSRQVLVQWAPIAEASFYRVYQKGLDEKMEALRDVKDVQISLSCSPDRSSAVQVETHLSSGAFSRKSGLLTVAACPPPLNLKSGSVFPPYLARYGKYKTPRLEISWSGETLNRDVVVQTAATPDFKNAKIVKMKSETYLEVPQAESLYVRIRQDLLPPEFQTQWSSMVKAEKANQTAMRMPLLVQPPSQEVLFQFKDQPSEIELRWQPVGGAIEYDVEIARTVDFKEVIYKKSVNKPPLYLPEKWPQGNYYWRVRAVDYFTESAWTSPWNFRVVTGD